MNESVTKEAEAPFGLDFEWPDELWALRDGVWWWGAERDGDLFRIILPSEADAWALRNLHSTIWDEALSHLPQKTAWDEALDLAASEAVGIVLLDRHGRELARRYCC